MSSNASVVLETAPSQAEVEKARAYFQMTQACLAGAIQGLSQAQWEFAPPQRWSIAQNARHIVTVNLSVANMVREKLADAPAPPADRDHTPIDALILALFPQRFDRFNAPEAVVPVDLYATPAEALKAVSASFEQLDQALQTPGLRDHLLPARPLKAMTKGTHDSMDGYQWILAATAHAERHVKQLLEVRGDANFPRA